MTDSARPTPADARLGLLKQRAHQLYLERNEWVNALPLWELCARLAPPTLDVQLALAHCRIELGADGDTGGELEQSSSPDGVEHVYADLIRTRACTWLLDGDAARAARLMRLVAFDRHLASVYATQILPSGDGADGGIPAPGRDPEPLPFERAGRLEDADAWAVIDRHRARRVLFFVPSASTPGPDGVATEETLCRYLRVSLEALGVSVTIFESQARRFGERPFPDRLRETIAAVRPDVIVAYDLTVSGRSADAELQPVILSILQDARRELGTRLVITYSDTWYEGAPALLDAIVDLADLFHITFPGLFARVAPRVAAKTLCYPYPCYDPRPTDAPVPPQQARASFVGGLSWANLSRLVWWTEMKNAGLPVDLHPTANLVARTPAAYAALLAGYQVSVSLTARISGDRVFTLRTAEAPLYGSLLLEENSDDTPYFMRPFEHYVPFDTLAQLSGRLRLVLEDDALRTRITRAGGDWVRRHFTGLHFWARLFRQLYEGGVGAPVAAPIPHGDLPKVRFPFSPETYAVLARPLLPLTGNGP